MQQARQNEWDNNFITHSLLNDYFFHFSCSLIPEANCLSLIIPLDAVSIMQGIS
jgi:hypothetical protein